jgi:cyclic pyranopterin phosphate synthase
MNFSHFDNKGHAIMVNVSDKQPTLRTATVDATICLRSETLRLIKEGQMKKGDVFGVARIAGIAAAKKTPDLIPLSHPIALHAVSIEFEVVEEPRSSIFIHATVTAFERTGVEMEAMIAASTSAMTIYDMCKAVDRSMTIGDISLQYKSGGKSGVYQRKRSENDKSCNTDS